MNNNIEVVCCLFQVSSGLHFFMDKRRACGLWKWTSPELFQPSPQKKLFYKISSYQGFTGKQTLIWWFCYHLGTEIHNPRRNIELIMGRIKCKQSTSLE